MLNDLLELTGEHLMLVAIAMTLAIAIGVPFTASTEAARAVKAGATMMSQWTLFRTSGASAEK